MGLEVLSRSGTTEGPKSESWPIVLAMRNWEFYLAVVAVALLTLRRIRPSAIRLVAQFLPPSLRSVPYAVPSNERPPRTVVLLNACCPCVGGART